MQEMDIIIDFVHEFCLLFKYRTDKNKKEIAREDRFSRSKDSFVIYNLKNAEYISFNVNYKGNVENVKKEVLPDIKNITALIKMLKNKYVCDF